MHIYCNYSFASPSLLNKKAAVLQAASITRRLFSRSI